MPSRLRLLKAHAPEKTAERPVSKQSRGTSSPFPRRTVAAVEEASRCSGLYTAADTKKKKAGRSRAPQAVPEIRRTIPAVAESASLWKRLLREKTRGREKHARRGKRTTRNEKTSAPSGDSGTSSYRGRAPATSRARETEPQVRGAFHDAPDTKNWKNLSSMQAGDKTRKGFCAGPKRLLSWCEEQRQPRRPRSSRTC